MLHTHLHLSEVLFVDSRQHPFRKIASSCPATTIVGIGIIEALVHEESICLLSCPVAWQSKMTCSLTHLPG